MVEISFVKNQRLYHRKFHFRSDPLLRAIGVKSIMPNLSVYDLTLGLARDAWQMCQAGCRVVGFEQYSPLAEKLEQARQEALQQGLDLKRVAELLTIVNGSVFEMDSSIGTLYGQPDVVYIDPMFAEDQVGSALPKKETQWLRSLPLISAPDEKFWEQALQFRPRRIVWKRPPKSHPAIAKPSFQIKGKSIRFDIYEGVYR